MRHAPHYQVCSLETDRRDLPLIDFNEAGLDCTMVVLSAYAARLTITSVMNPFAGITDGPRSKLGPMKIWAIEYVIVCERANGKFESQSYRHGFKTPPALSENLIRSEGKLFIVEDLGVLLNRMRKSALGPKVNAKEFKGIKAIQFIA